MATKKEAEKVVHAAYILHKIDENLTKARKLMSPRTYARAKSRLKKAHKALRAQMKGM